MPVDIMLVYIVVVKWLHSRGVYEKVVDKRVVGTQLIASHRRQVKPDPHWLYFTDKEQVEKYTSVYGRRNAIFTKS